MIIFDTETTGLHKPESIPLNQQPEIIEFGMLRLDDDLAEVGQLWFLCRPKIWWPLPPEIPKITGITDEMLQEEKPFSFYVPQIRQFARSEEVWASHNAPFDRGMLLFELRRLDMVTKFPWPDRHICTVETTFQIKGRRMKMEELYTYLFGRPANQTHRAIDDCRQLAEIVRELRKRDMM
jgi:DNA polymerase III epsilon subunit-like protein